MSRSPRCTVGEGRGAAAGCAGRGEGSSGSHGRCGGLVVADTGLGSPSLADGRLINVMVQRASLKG